tara:strand:+ start:1306 stop:2403 length:1098 start_codon:yes stop_codon:yes gene_type:complete
MAESLGVSMMSVSRLVKELVTEGICLTDEGANKRGSLGRRPSFISLNPSYGWVVAICLSAFSKAISISDITGKKHLETSIPEDVSVTPKDAVQFIKETIEKFLSMQDSTIGKLLGCSVVVAGKFDVQSGVLLSAPLLNWPDTNLQTQIENALQCRVVVDNIANALCINHVDTIQVQTSKTPNIMLVHVAAGMGASLFINGHLVRRGGDEGWIGQIKIPQFKQDFNCRLSLCDVVSGRAIMTELTKHRSFEVDQEADFATNFQKAVDEANRGNQRFSEVFRESGKVLGRNLFFLSAGSQPDLVVLAGPVRQARSYEEGVYQGFEEENDAASETWTSIEVSKCTYIDAAENLALREYFYQPGHLPTV